MEKIIEGHLVGFGYVKDMQHLEDDYYGEFTDAGMSERQYDIYKNIPNKEECDQICETLSGVIRVF